MLHRFSLPKAFEIFYCKADRKKQFCKNDGYEVLLQPLTTQKRTCSNTVLRFRLRIAFFIFEDVLDL